MKQPLAVILACTPCQCRQAGWSRGPAGGGGGLINFQMAQFGAKYFPSDFQEF